MSSDLYRAQTVPTNPTAAVAVAGTGRVASDGKRNRVPRTRIGAAWFGVCAAAFLFVMLIVSLAQNTHRVEVTFLWTYASLPLALALLIAAVAAAILAVAVGAARITQLRRL